ncbi:MAG: hypothetical protein K0R90_847 [Oscillospiraceae bacterium]|nr:hypothetical protein [Oscillospiraceae bacterium]
MKRIICVTLILSALLCGCNASDGSKQSSSKSSSVPSVSSAATEANIKPANGIVTIPNANSDDWALFLVNNYNKLPDNYSVPLANVTPDRQFHKKAVDDFKQMLEGAKTAGYNLYIVSTYRSVAYQKNLYQRNVNSLVSQGKTQKEAEKETSVNIAQPGKSEHNTGLATDIVSGDWFTKHTDLTQDFEDTPEFQWLYENSPKYGFILRYPKNKQDITEITYEPWHYRYVGKKYAQKIKDSGLTLEEYMKNQVK